MLEKIKYGGFEISSSQFVQHKDSEGGRFKLSVDKCQFGYDYNESEEKGNIQIIVESSIKGFDEQALEDPENPNEDGLAFEVNSKILVYFDVEDKQPITDEFCKENAWFFENFYSIPMKLALESTMQNTPMQSIDLPWHIPSIATEE